MDLSDSSPGAGSGETTRVDRRRSDDQWKRPAESTTMNAARTGETTTLMANETPNTASTPPETYTVEITTVDEIREETDGVTHLTGGAD